MKHQKSFAPITFFGNVFSNTLWSWFDFKDFELLDDSEMIAGFMQ